jgi:hypothetical protein
VVGVAVIDTRSDVKLIAPAWWKLGWEPWVVFAGVVAVYVRAFYCAPHDAVVEHAQTNFSFFTTSSAASRGAG